MSIRVVLADDQELVRAGFRMILETRADIEVVGDAGDGVEAVAATRRLQPDVVLMDIRMPRLDGIAATEAIARDESLGSVRVLILTTFESDDTVVDALRAGAGGFLVKDTEPAELIRAVRTIAAGEALLSPGATRRLIAQVIGRPAGPRSDPSVLRELTPRELEVMALVAEGLANDEIAERLVVSPLTAKTHVSRIMLKLSARDRAQLVVMAYQSGLVRAPDAPNDSDNT
jgi:DNA-binding NarL/FixJ family response regulator